MEICGMLIRDRVTKPLRISKRHLDRAVSALPVMLPELMLPFSIWTDIGIPPNWQMSWENDRKPCTNYGKMIQTDGTLFRMIQNKDGSESLRFGGSYFKTSLIGKQSTNQPFHLKKKNSTRHCQSVMHVAALCMPWLHHRVEDEVDLRHLLVNETTKEFLSNPGQITIFH